MSRLGYACVVEGVLLLLSGAVEAQEVKYTFNATLIELADGGPPAPYEEVQLGAPLTLSLCIDTSTPDQQPQDPTFGLYTGATSSVTLDVDGIVNSFVPDALNAFVISTGGGQDPADALALQVATGAPVVNVSLFDADGTAFVEDSLPDCTELDLDDFSGRFDSAWVTFGFSSWGIFEIQSIECSTCEEPECFLVIGNPRVPGDSFAPYSHAFDTQVGAVEEWYPVLLDDIPEFVIWEAQPSMRAALAGIDPTVSAHGRMLGGQVATGGADESLGPGTALGLDIVTYADPLPTVFTAQVLMWNPTVFPSNPEQYTHGLAVRILPNGDVVTVPYGVNDGGMEIWAETEWNDQGQKVLRLPFSIPGF